MLKGGTDPYISTQALACAMVMHLVGDIHQPLHAAAHYLVSHHRLQNDAGGNREDVENGPVEEQLFSLHMFWDSAWRASLDAAGRVVLDDRYRGRDSTVPRRSRRSRGHSWLSRRPGSPCC